MKKVYLFLDFDGVLHKSGGISFSKVNILEKAVKKYDNLFIVFSTSWREHSTLERLTARMPVSIQPKCVGMTPVIKEPITYCRYHEILLYNTEHGIEDNWFALDDMKTLFPPNFPHLLWVDPKQALTEAHIHLIKQRIENLSRE